MDWENQSERILDLIICMYGMAGEPLPEFIADLTEEADDEA